MSAKRVNKSSKNSKNPEPELSTTQPSTGSKFKTWKRSLKRRRGLNSSKVAAGVVALVLVAGLGFVGGLVGSNTNTISLGGGNLSKQKRVVSSQSQLISQIAKNVGPSVVSVNVTSQQQLSGSSFFGGAATQQRSAGTGIIISSDGLIITNRHVVPAGTTNVSVTLSDGTKLKQVKVVGRTNSKDSLDIAFLKVKNRQGHKLKPAQLGDSGKIKVGDAVVAIGNALGQFQNTVTSGIISGFGRSVQASSADNSSDSENLTDLFQTDAAINEGNSGGPLTNLNGQVIGINTAIAGNAQNVGFSIPVNDVKGLVKQVVSTGKLRRPFLGVRYVPLTDDFAFDFNLSVKRGAYIAPSGDFGGQPSVLPGGPAAKAGLKEKDIIVQVDGTKVNDKHSLTSLLSQHQPGDKVNLKIIRNAKTLHKTVKLGTAPSANG